MSHVLVIAEAGVNHNGKLQTAKELIDAAVYAGADIVKFQTFSADRLTTSRAPKATYQKLSTPSSESQREMLAGLELSAEMHFALIEYCRERGIEFLSTGFDVQDMIFLSALNLDRYKIPSGELTNLPYLRAVGNLKKPVIISTGVATLGEIEQAISILVASGTPRDLITILHCTSNYPALMSQVNLKSMQNLRMAFGLPVGYSDHTEGTEVAIAAVALGAEVIEKHFTLDRNMPGPDHKASLEPNELKEMISAIRNIEVALGSGVKTLDHDILETKRIIEKSIVAKVSIAKGEIFSELNITTKRPAGGISPMLWDKVIGQVAKRDFELDEEIET